MSFWVKTPSTNRTGVATNKFGLSGVGILLAEKWLNNVLKVERFADRIMLLKLVIGKAVLTLYDKFFMMARVCLYMIIN